MIRHNPRLIMKRSFVRRASLVNFTLPITVRLRGSDSVNNPNTASLDLGASLGQRTIGLGGSLSGEIVFHDSFDGGALGNVDVVLDPGPKGLTTTSVPLLWNTDTTGFGTTIAPVFHLGAGTAGCGDFHGYAPLTIAGNQTVPYYTSQANADSNTVAGYVPDTPGVDDPARLTASPAVGNSDNLGPNANPFPYTAQSNPGGFSQPPNVGDTIFRTAPLTLTIATPGTEVNQTDTSVDGPQGGQNIVIGKSGGQANLFGNIPGRPYGIDVTVNLATRINSILRAMDPDFVPLITTNPWPTTFSECRQAYTGAVQNYLPGIRLQGNLHISPAITSDGKLRIAKATLTTQQPAHIALAACLFPYSLYTAQNNNSDTVSQTVNDYAANGNLPTNEYVARGAPTNVDCGATPTKLVQDAPTLNLAAASVANGYTTVVDGSRVSVSGDITTSVSADILIGDQDSPPPAPPIGNKYVALGDSIAYGYQQAKFNAEYPSIIPSTFNTGYVDNFSSFLQGINAGITTVNLGCPGETTSSLINGYLQNQVSVPGPECGRGSGWPYVWLHTSYGFGNTQLQAAVAQLGSSPTPSNPVTLDIGANDLLVFLGSCGFGTISFSPSCVTSGLQAQFNTIVANIKTILETLQATAPNARYLVMGLYNPYPTVLNVGGITGDAAIGQLNSMIKAVALTHHARFVDPLPTFNPSGTSGGPESGDIPAICNLTGMCPGNVFNPSTGDIHPSDLGYKALASLFESASGF